MGARAERCKLPLRAKAETDRQTLFMLFWSPEIAACCNSLPMTGDIFHGQKMYCTSVGCIPLTPTPWISHSAHRLETKPIVRCIRSSTHYFPTVPYFLSAALISWYHGTSIVNTAWYLDSESRCKYRAVSCTTVPLSLSRCVEYSHKPLASICIQ